VLAHLGVVRACLALLTGGRPGAPRRFVKVFGPTAARTLERLVGEVRKLPPEVHPIVQAHWCNPKGFRAIGAHLSALAHGVPPAAIRSSPTIPTVVISSRDQPPQQLTAHRQLAGESTEGRHLIATRSAHWVQFDEPGLVVEAVRELVYKAQGAVRRTQGTEHGAQG
jgi:pimeloyl-ACP methyl ester carboxylesterase